MLNNLLGRKLARCPECGGWDIRGFVISTTEVSDDRAGKAYIECRNPKCHAMTHYYKSFEQAERAWDLGIVHHPDSKELMQHFGLIGNKVISVTNGRRVLV